MLIEDFEEFIDTHGTGDRAMKKLVDTIIENADVDLNIDRPIEREEPELESQGRRYIILFPFAVGINQEESADLVLTLALNKSFLEDLDRKHAATAELNASTEYDTEQKMLRLGLEDDYLTFEYDLIKLGEKVAR